MQRFLPDELPNTKSQKETEIALTFELTSRLNAMDSHPMNRVLGFGAKYLQDYLSPWVNQQGGYVSALKTYCQARPTFTLSHLFLFFFPFHYYPQVLNDYFKNVVVFSFQETVFSADNDPEEEIH